MAMRLPHDCAKTLAKATQRCRHLDSDSCYILTMKNNNTLQVMVNRNTYSADAQRRTRDGIDQLYVHLFMHEHRCHLKNSNIGGELSFGFISLDNAMAGRLKVEEKDGDRVWHYASVDDLVNDGWVVD